MSQSINQDEERESFMNLTLFLQELEKYGLLIVFLIVFLEYLNLPGFPAGVILPCSGVWAAKGHNLLLTFGVTVAAGLLGSILLYYVGKFGGRRILKICMGKSERIRKPMNHYNVRLKCRGARQSLSASFFL